MRDAPWRNGHRSIVVWCCDVEHPAAKLYEGCSGAADSPAIDALQQHTEVLNVDGARIIGCGCWNKPRLIMRRSMRRPTRWAQLALAPDHSDVEENIDLEIEGRPIRCRRCADDVVVRFRCALRWSAVRTTTSSRPSHMRCSSVNAPSSAGVKRTGAPFHQPGRWFYDHNVKLIVSAAPVETLYQGERLTFN
jgi:cell division protein ZapE